MERGVSVTSCLTWAGQWLLGYWNMGRRGVVRDSNPELAASTSCLLHLEPELPWRKTMWRSHKPLQETDLSPASQQVSETLLVPSDQTSCWLNPGKWPQSMPHGTRDSLDPQTVNIVQWLLLFSATKLGCFVTNTQPEQSGKQLRSILPRGHFPPLESRPKPAICFLSEPKLSGQRDFHWRKQVKTKTESPVPDWLGARCLSFRKCKAPPGNLLDPCCPPWPLKW